MTLLQEVLRESRETFPINDRERNWIVNKWSRLDSLTISGNIIQKVSDVLIAKKYKPVVLSDDSLYSIHSGRPKIRREIVFLSGASILPVIVFELQNSVQSQPFEITFFFEQNTNIKSSLSPNAKSPSWWPEEYSEIEAFDLSQEKSREVCQKSDRQNFLNEDNIFGHLEIPIDSDFAYMWERSEKEIKNLLNSINLRI